MSNENENEKPPYLEDVEVFDKERGGLYRVLAPKEDAPDEEDFAGLVGVHGTCPCDGCREVYERGDAVRLSFGMGYTVEVPLDEVELLTSDPIEADRLFDAWMNGLPISDTPPWFEDRVRTVLHVGRWELEASFARRSSQGLLAQLMAHGAEVVSFGAIGPDGEPVPEYPGEEGKV